MGQGSPPGTFMTGDFQAKGLEGPAGKEEGGKPQASSPYLREDGSRGFISSFIRHLQMPLPTKVEKRQEWPPGLMSFPSQHCPKLCPIPFRTRHVLELGLFKWDPVFGLKARDPFRTFLGLEKWKNNWTGAPGSWVSIPTVPSSSLIELGKLCSSLQAFVPSAIKSSPV